MVLVWLAAVWDLRWHFSMTAPAAALGLKQRPGGSGSWLRLKALGLYFKPSPGPAATESRCAKHEKDQWGDRQVIGVVTPVWS